MSFFSRTWLFVLDRFNFRGDRADEAEIVANIKKEIHFKGANLWTLIFAIVIASIGLNVNSTAVIIGAMLISPIMGPVTGLGMGMAINDLALVKRSTKNLLVATLFSVGASTIYFAVSPLHTAQSELLARTSPTIWDVFIAFFGGLAGMVAASKRERSNVIPGVAIATALMPPLCTAGFGIATGHWSYFLGAIYLYFINSVFITIATYLMTRYLDIHKGFHDDPAREKKVARYLMVIAAVMIIPSILMAYQIVDKSVFEKNARAFIDKEFNFANTQVVSRTYNYSRTNKTIDLLLIGKELSKATIDSLSMDLHRFGLAGVKLLIRQGLDARQQVDLAQIRASILEDVFAGRLAADSIALATKQEDISDTVILSELKALYPTVRSFGYNKLITRSTDSPRSDTLHIAAANFTRKPGTTDLKKAEAWLRVRLKSPDLKLVLKYP